MRGLKGGEGRGVARDWNSALFIILNGTKEEHLDMLDGGVIQRLLEDKWKTFARLQFLKRLVILVFHLMSLSLAVYFRPADIEAELMYWPEELTDVVRVIAECTTVLGVLGYIFIQLGGEIVNIGFLSFFKQLSHDPAKFIFLISNLLILACIPYRLDGDRHTEDAILIVAVPGSWFLLMFFAGAVRLTGPFVTMIYSMITGDMLTFGIIYVVVLLGFSQSFYFLYKGFPGVKSTLYHSYHSTWMALFQITLGDYSYTDLSFTTYPNLSKTVFAIFLVLVPILLLNMLIAMMGNTYAHVIEQSEKEWMKQWAKIVVSLERAVSQEDAHNYLEEYSIKLGEAERGIMVIKTKSKTRARQRKGAVSNWKRVGKVTIAELKKRGMTGEELRRIMWGRASVSTPVRASPTLNAAMSSAPGGFGDALTSALDVMTFAADVPELMADSQKQQHQPGVKPVALANGAKPVAQATTVAKDAPSVKMTKQEKTPAPVKSMVPVPAKTIAIVPTPTQATAKEHQAQPEKPSTICSSEDPLLELAIAAEQAEPDEERLRRLAHSARLVGEAGSSGPDQGLNPDGEPSFLEKLALGGLGLGVMPEQPSQPAEPAKPRYFAESSDTDLCIDEVQLGTEARLRRIRSASSRLATEAGLAKLQQQQRRRRLVQTRKSSSSAERCCPGLYSCSSSSSVSSLLVPTTTTTTTTTTTGTTTINQRTEATRVVIATSAADSGGGKIAKARRSRPRTGKNRVSPKDTSNEYIQGWKDKPVEQKSSEADQAPEAGGDEDDPLEPWSTRSIKDMKEILPWKEPNPDSP
ncbi:hypothetical protein QAD02_003960 [Eretmocerus hayati]|uniref:Uncharacterized protein n=1 Tax=Eretmocerus hayati TaxID=131215 RepID=A0ACC2NN53_9HYME|nr:hypothetical protein QAD02_003960 [Eretmocerus hayati]